MNRPDTMIRLTNEEVHKFALARITLWDATIAKGHCVTAWQREAMQLWQAECLLRGENWLAESIEERLKGTT